MGKTCIWSTVSAWGGTTTEQPYWKCHLLSYFPFLPLCYVYLIAALGSQGERRWETPEIFFPGLQGEQSLAKQKEAWDLWLSGLEGFAGAVKMCSSESVHWQHPDVRAIPKWPGPSPALLVRGEGEREGSCWHMWAEKFQSAGRAPLECLFGSCICNSRVEWASGNRERVEGFFLPSPMVHTGGLIVKGNNHALWKWKSFSHDQLYMTPWTVTLQAPLSMEFSRQEYWGALPFPSPGIFLIQGLNLCLLHWRQILYCLKSPGKPSHALDIFKKWYGLLCALGRPRGRVWEGRREEDSGWGTRVYLWRIHVDVWQNQYNIVK